MIKVLQKMADNRTRLSLPTLLRSMRKPAVRLACLLLLLLDVSCSESRTAAHKTASSHTGAFFKDYVELRFPTIVESPLLKSNITDMTNEGIDSLLRILLIRDQKIRDSLVTARRAASDSSQDIVGLGNKMEKIDAINLVVLNQIFEKIGWPSNSIFSDSVVNAAFYITLHTHGDLSHLSPLLEKAFKLGQIDISHYAVLTDRILLRAGLLQKYGTHCRQNNDGSKNFFNSEDSETVANNRALVGLHALDPSFCELTFY